MAELTIEELLRQSENDVGGSLTGNRFEAARKAQDVEDRRVSDQSVPVADTSTFLPIPVPSQLGVDAGINDVRRPSQSELLKYLIDVEMLNPDPLRRRR
jgi:hypothetical protein